jgi:hypothetical protein
MCKLCGHDPCSCLELTIEEQQNYCATCCVALPSWYSGEFCSDACQYANPILEDHSKYNKEG